MKKVNKDTKFTVNKQCDESNEKVTNVIENKIKPS
jgi:hypothetical protein